MQNKGKYIIVILVVIICVLGFLIFKDDKLEQNWSTDTTNSIDININTDDGDKDIDWSKYSNKDYQLNRSLVIKENGTYNLTGTIDDGLIIVETNGNVKLNLNNVSITNSNGPAIYIKSAENVVINLVEGSKNVLTDGNSYDNYEEDVKATLYSSDDLIIEGTGKLVINGFYQDGIVSKDDLKIINGIYEINAKDDGIRGKDSLYIIDGSFTIESGADAIKSTNDTDIEKGFILIENGIYNLTSEEDGIQAETKILIKNGKFNIKTGGGSNNSSDNFYWGNWGSSSNEQSAKGIKSGDNLVINNGTFTFDTSDDAIHSNNYAGIKDGNFFISSGDDGIHADTEIIIDNGEIDISKSYEGIESAKITINDSNIRLVSSDDGINIAGGNDSSSMNRPGANHYTNNKDNILTINDGKIYINSKGDGIDVNGSAYINDGNIIVDGPTDNGNGILDYDNYFIINGGELIAAGSSGMFQKLSESSKIYSINIYFTSKIASGSKITITNSNKKEVISYTTTKTVDAILVASEKLENNTRYTIKIDNNEYYTFTISNLITTIGNNKNQEIPGNRPPGRR